MSAIFLSSPPGKIYIHFSDGAVAQNAFGTLVWAMTSKMDWKEIHKKFHFISLHAHLTGKQVSLDISSYKISGKILIWYTY